MGSPYEPGPGGGPVYIYRYVYSHRETHVWLGSEFEPVQSDMCKHTSEHCVKLFESILSPD